MTITTYISYSGKGECVEEIDWEHKDNEATAHPQQGPGHLCVTDLDLPERSRLRTYAKKNDVLPCADAA